ncbi:MAG: flap endonuclease [Actinomycetota bacterium]|nr:flap endonuclease [Actinomycetota bacterium]
MDDSLTLLVDAPSLIYRALFSTPDSVTMPDGTPINAGHGFLRMLARLVGDQDPDYICCAADENWRPAWRVELLETYKAHRAEAGSQQEESEKRLAPQVPVIYELLEACGVKVIGHPDAEAEDVIGTLARRAPGRVAIFSGDRDLFQLVEDPRCFIIYPIRGVSQVDVIDESYIENKYGIPGRSYGDFAVLRGDPSDGLPGVRGIGDKLATSLVSKYGSLDAIIEAAQNDKPSVVMSKVKNDLDYVERARRVVSISCDLSIDEVDLTRPREIDETAVRAKAAEYGLENSARALMAALKG